MRGGRLKRTIKLLTPAAVAFIVTFEVLRIVFPFPEERIEEAQAGGSVLMLDRRYRRIAWRVDPSENWRLPIRVEEASDWLVKATEAAEDGRFRSHEGVDALAVARAFCQNVACRRRISGASTITMQTIRLIWPRRRTYPAKCIEAFRALQIEDIASKDEIMQLYLNLAPYGGNVIGAEAAARRYFGKGAKELSLGEAALLAGLPQRPARFDPRRNLESALRRREYVFRRMRYLRLATEGEVLRARDERIEILSGPAGVAVPRFVDHVAQLRSDGGTLRTTLDLEVQAVVEEEAAGHIARLRALRIDGLAVVVLDVAASELVAMIGSADPADPVVGQVNCATARRQPGSLLKPFIYASAFDSGLLTPRSVVYDIPTAWKGYRPENMDRDFLGPIPAARALSESRNVPAVRLLDRIGPSRLARDVSRLGLKIEAAEERCGLSLALGTAEVRLLDIANAYAALAREGELLQARVFADEGDTRARRVYSRASAYLALRSLGASAPGGHLRPAWKTGTSWNHRDAWAVTLTAEYVVAVWSGRLSGHGHPALTGARAALPLALDILDRLTTPRCIPWKRPDTVRTRKVCALSGAPATAACPHTCSAEYVPGVSAEAPCSVHRFASDGGKRRVVTVWPGEVANYLAGRDTRDARGGKPSIEMVSPADGGEYVLVESGSAAGRTLEFSARAPRGSSHIYWYLDDELLARLPAHQPLRWPMRPGRYEVIAADASGASAKASFCVLENPTASRAFR